VTLNDDPVFRALPRPTRAFVRLNWWLVEHHEGVGRAIHELVLFVLFLLLAGLIQ
jgi:hypothetical protein